MTSTTLGRRAAQPTQVAGERLLWVGLSVLGALFVAASFIPDHGYDLRSYTTIDLADPYAGISGLTDYAVFRYPPPMALAMAPLAALPWEVVVVAWLAAQLAALYVIAGRWALALVLFPPVWLDITYGNVNIFLAAMIAVGFRAPGSWAFGLLTKVTPGVGLAWFAARLELRPLAIAGAVTAAAAAVSVVILGLEPWADWVALLVASTSMATPPDALPVPLAPRIVAAAALIAWGARTDRRWTVPVGVALAMPVLWVIALAPLAALASPEVRQRVSR
jgi:hypothetical protein